MPNDFRTVFSCGQLLVLKLSPLLSSPLFLSLSLSFHVSLGVLTFSSHFAAEIFAGAMRVLAGAPELIKAGSAIWMDFPRRTILAKGEDWRDEPYVSQTLFFLYEAAILIRFLFLSNSVIDNGGGILG